MLSVQNFKSFLKNFKIISISPFYHLEATDGVTARIVFICWLLEDLSEVSLFAMRWNLSCNNKYIPSQNLFLGTKNKFFHLLDLRILLKIFFFRRKHLIYCHSIWSGFYALFALFFLKIPYIFDDHNVEFDRFVSTKRFVLAPFMLFFEKILVAFSYITVVWSDADRLRLIELYWQKNKIIVLPIEIKKKSISINKDNLFLNNGIPASPITLLFFASFNYYPNLESLRFIETEIAPFLSQKYQILICGKDLPTPAHPPSNIVYLGYVDYLDELILSSDCIIAPIFSWWWVKTKIIHAMSYNKLIITTHEWVRGISIEKYNQIIISDKTNFLQDIFRFLN